MNTEGFRRLLFGDKEPDINDPKVRARYEREVAAGRRFARFAHLDKAAAKVQQFALDHTKAFLIIVFGFIGLSFSMNIVKMAVVYNNQREYKSAMAMQDSVMKKRGITTYKIKNKLSTTHEDNR